MYLQKRGGNQQCETENRVEYNIMSYWGGNIQKKIKTLRLRIMRRTRLRVTGL
jgi:hypothetical protein